MKKDAGKIIFIGLSGGVDSAVAAALLKRQGYQVAGVFMRFWKPRNYAELKSRGTTRRAQVVDKNVYENSCCSVESEATARSVAAKLGIPFYVFDFSREFKRKVVDYFLAELSSGRTPNPCVVCNPEIKFGLFLERARKLGVDYVATGHYARTAVIATPQQRGKQSRGRSNKAGSPRRFAPRDDIFGLFAAKDKQKDQSYFLYRLTQEQLGRVLWPLGDYLKSDVYKLAKQWRLPHQACQSFDVCFIEDYGKFLGRYLKMKPGGIVKYNPPQPPLKLRGGEAPTFGRREGELLGTHQGLPLYTIGQRTSIGGPGPFYVVGKDIKKNILYVSNNERDLYQKEMLVENVNWLAGEAPLLRQGFGGQALKCKVKIRYQAEATNAVIARSERSERRGNPVDGGSMAGLPRAFGARNDVLLVKFVKPQRAITPGQSAVFYGKNNEVLGGGVIVK